jgi:hypothetical protein
MQKQKENIWIKANGALEGEGAASKCSAKGKHGYESVIGLYEYLACFVFFSSLLHPAYHLFTPSQLARVNKSGCKLDTQLIASQITPGLGGTQHQILNREA